MIKSFRHRGLKRLFERGDKSQVRADMLDKIENILAVLDHADAPEKMDLPGFRLHPMTGDLRGSGLSPSAPTGGLSGAMTEPTPWTWD
jgi:toxin HigB-1